VLTRAVVEQEAHAKRQRAPGQARGLVQRAVIAPARPDLPQQRSDDGPQPRRRRVKRHARAHVADTVGRSVQRHAAREQWPQLLALGRDDGDVAAHQRRQHANVLNGLALLRQRRLRFRHGRSVHVERVERGSFRALRLVH